MGVPPASKCLWRLFQSISYSSDIEKWTLSLLWGRDTLGKMQVSTRKHWSRYHGTHRNLFGNLWSIVTSSGFSVSWEEKGLSQHLLSETLLSGDVRGFPATFFVQALCCFTKPQPFPSSCSCHKSWQEKRWKTSVPALSGFYFSFSS